MKMTPEQIVDELMYRCYANNRRDTTAKRLSLLFLDSAAFEVRYRREHPGPEPDRSNELSEAYIRRDEIRRDEDSGNRNW